MWVGVVASSDCDVNVHVGCGGGASLENLAHARNECQQTSIELQLVQIIFNPQTRKFKIGQSSVLSTSAFKQWKQRRNTPTTHTKYKLGWA